MNSNNKNSFRSVVDYEQINVETIVDFKRKYLLYYKDLLCWCLDDTFGQEVEEITDDLLYLFIDSCKSLNEEILKMYTQWSLSDQSYELYKQKLWSFLDVNNENALVLLTTTSSLHFNGLVMEFLREKSKTKIELSITDQKKIAQYIERLNELYYSDYIMRFLNKFTKNDHRSSEILSHWYEKALLAIRHWKFDLSSTQSQLKSWFTTILRNLFFNEWKKKKRMKVYYPENDRELEIHVWNKAYSDIGDLQKEDILSYLKKTWLPRVEIISMLADWYSYKEIADHFDLHIWTIKSSIYRIRAVCKNDIDDF